MPKQELNLSHAGVILYNLFQLVGSSDPDIDALFLSTRTGLQAVAQRYFSIADEIAPCESRQNPAKIQNCLFSDSFLSIVSNTCVEVEGSGMCDILATEIYFSYEKHRSFDARVQED